MQFQHAKVVFLSKETNKKVARGLPAVMRNERNGEFVTPAALSW